MSVDAANLKPSVLRSCTSKRIILGATMAGQWGRHCSKWIVLLLMLALSNLVFSNAVFSNTVDSDRAIPAAVEAEDVVKATEGELPSQTPTKLGSKLKLTSPAPLANGVFDQGQFGNAVLGLLFVIAMVLGSAWLVKRTNLVKYGQQGDLKVISSVSIGQKEKILLLKVRGVELVVGATAHNINILHSFAENESPDDADVSKQAEPGSEGDWLSQISNPHSNNHTPARNGFAEKLQSLLEKGR